MIVFELPEKGVGVLMAGGGVKRLCKDSQVGRNRNRSFQNSVFTINIHIW